MSGKTVWGIAGVVLVLVGVISLAIWLTGSKGAQKQASYFADSTPAAGETLPASPIALVLNFTQDVASVTSFDVLSESDSSATFDTLQPAEIDQLKTTVRRAITKPLEDGQYRVTYEVCFADTTCDQGSFTFKVDRTQLMGSDFIDKRGQQTVLVELDQLAFSPKKIIVSPNTTVTWRNAESVEHYVNTETHPYHTYVLDHNSRGLGKGAEFSYTFVQPGAYPYHCSAHATVMTGMIVVDG
jgi:plastocyanin